MSTLFTLLALLFAAVFAGTVISGAFAYTAHALRNPRLVEERFRPSSLRLAFHLVLIESSALLLTLFAHPLGWRREKAIRHRPPGAPPSGTPVLVLHGLFHNRISCWWICRFLRPRCRGGVYSINIPVWGHIEGAVDIVAERIDELRIALGVEKVHLVGHSMGGIVARQYLRREKSAGKIDRCILLGSPNGGSVLAPLALSPLGKLLIPGSPFLRELAELPLPPQTRFCAIYSRHDNLVVPWDSGRLEGVRNIELSGMMHCTLLYHPKAMQAIAEVLTEERKCSPST